MDINIVLKKRYIFLFLFSPAIFCITGVYYQSISIALHNMAFLLILFFFFFFKEKYIIPFINSSTIFICIVIVGAYIGFIYALSGGQPFFNFPNPDTRLNNLYLTTFAHKPYIGNFIRPNGIYDEAGALSFIICGICLSRVLYNKNDNTTFIILLLGLITFSLTHVLVVLCFFIHYILKYKKKKRTLYYILGFIALLAILIASFYDVFDELLFSRFEYNSSTGTLAGDNRSSLFKNALNFLDTKTFLWGLDESLFKGDRSIIKKTGGMGANPLEPLLSYGIFSAWHYYLFLVIIFLAGLINRKYFFIFSAICLLYFQRPYPNSLGYSFYFILFFSCAFSTIKIELGKKRNLLRFL
jgi:hypothetical protein